MVKCIGFVIGINLLFSQTTELNLLGLRQELTTLLKCMATVTKTSDTNMEIPNILETMIRILEYKIYDT